MSSKCSGFKRPTAEHRGHEAVPTVRNGHNLTFTSRLWDSVRPLFNGYRELFPRDSKLILPLPLYALMACTGTSLPLPLQTVQFQRHVYLVSCSPRSNSCYGWYLYLLLLLLLLLLFLAQQPPVGQGTFIHEVSTSHTTTHHRRYDSSGRGISSSQRSLPDNTQHSHRSTSMPPVGFELTISAGERS